MPPAMKPANPVAGTPLVISDQELQRAISERLGSMGKTFKINVENGNVYLVGAVGTSYEGQYLSRVIQQISGVKVVRANLRIGALTASVKTSFDWRILPWSTLASVAGVLVLSLLVWSFLSRPERATLELLHVPVTFQVMNRPAVGACLTLHPMQTLRDANGQDLSGLHPRGFVGPDGQVEWTTLHRGDGIPPGQYVVTAIWHPTVSDNEEIVSSPNQLPAKYGDPGQSPLRLLVTSNTSQPNEQVLRIDSRK